jgi:hypothetical protein
MSGVVRRLDRLCHANLDAKQETGDPRTVKEASSVCNDFGNNIPYSEYLAAFSQIRIPVN